MPKKKVVETGVDDLMRIVKKDGKLSISDLSKKLKVSQKVVQRWVDFFVEEKKLGVEYKLTTPYVFFLEPKAVKNNDISMSKDEFAELKGANKKTNPSMAKITETDEDSGMLLEVEDIFSDDDNGDFELSMNEGKNVKVIKQKSNFEKVNLAFGKLEAVLNEGDLEKGYKLYSKIKDMQPRIKEAHHQDIVSDKIIKFNDYFLYNLKTLSHKLKSQSEKIISLIKEGHKALKQDDLDLANKMYAESLIEYEEISDFFKEEKRLVHSNIFNLYSAMLKYTFNKTLEHIEIISDKIDNIISEIETKLSKNELAEADKLFALLNPLYEKIPSNYLEEKLTVQNKILKLYKEVRISHRVDTLYQELLKLNKNVARTFEPTIKSDLEENLSDLKKFNDEKKTELEHSDSTDIKINTKNNSPKKESELDKEIEDKIQELEPIDFSSKENVDSLDNVDLSTNPADESTKLKINVPKPSEFNPSDADSKMSGINYINKMKLNALDKRQVLKNKSVNVDDLDVKKTSNPIDRKKQIETNFNKIENKLTPIPNLINTNKSADTQLQKSVDSNVVFNEAMELYNVRHYDVAKIKFDSIANINPKAKHMSDIITAMNNKQVNQTVQAPMAKSQMNTNVITDNQNNLPKNNVMVNNNINTSQINSDELLRQAYELATTRHISQAKNMLNEILLQEPNNKKAQDMLKVLNSN